MPELIFIANTLLVIMLVVFYMRSMKAKKVSDVLYRALHKSGNMLEKSGKILESMTASSEKMFSHLEDVEKEMEATRHELSDAYDSLRMEQKRNGKLDQLEIRYEQQQTELKRLSKFVSVATAKANSLLVENSRLRAANEQEDALGGKVEEEGKRLEVH